MTDKLDDLTKGYLVSSGKRLKEHDFFSRPPYFAFDSNPNDIAVGEASFIFAGPPARFTKGFIGTLMYLGYRVIIYDKNTSGFYHGMFINTSLNKHRIDLIVKLANVQFILKHDYHNNTFLKNISKIKPIGKLSSKDVK
jgi:hypothetical protein